MEQKKILIVEDDEFILETIINKFQNSGFSVSFSKNAEDALSSLGSDIPDLILLDIIFPKGNGFDFLREIKINDKFKDIPVVIFSNLGSDADIKKARDLGAVDYIIKASSSPGQVVMKVKEILNIE